MKKRTSFDPNIPNPEKLAKQRKLREKLNITKVLPCLTTRKQGGCY